MGFIPSQTLLSTKTSLCPSSQPRQPHRVSSSHLCSQEPKGPGVPVLPNQPSEQFPHVHSSSSVPSCSQNLLLLPLSSARVGAAPSLVIVQDFIAVMIINGYLHWEFNEYLHFLFVCLFLNWVIKEGSLVVSWICSTIGTSTGVSRSGQGSGQVRAATPELCDTPTEGQPALGSVPAFTEISRAMKTLTMTRLELTESSLQVIYLHRANCLVSNTYTLPWYFSEQL